MASQGKHEAVPSEAIQFKSSKLDANPFGKRVMKKVKVLGNEIAVDQREESDFISLTDMVKSSEGGSAVIENWLRNKNTVEFLGIWEEIYNPDFNSLEFERIKNLAGLNRFVLSVKQWVEKTKAIGVVARTGRYGGTFAHRDIAFEFASWISPQFKLYLIKEFQRLKEGERQTLDWDVRRNLAKINYRIHTDAIKTHLIPESLNKARSANTYANEADVLNVAFFGKTAREWRDENPGLKGNIRDQANGAQLVCLSNLESMNADLIKHGVSQTDRLQKLNAVAIEQMRLLVDDTRIKRLKGK